MTKPPHHIRQEVCLTRAPYREGRKPTAVKVYTVHNESKYLLVLGVPLVGASDELVKLFEVYGDIEEHRMLDEYPCEQFTEAHLIKYKKIQSARFAKRKLDDWSFYGGVLHVCYSPEFETIKETREKLTERRRVVESKVRQFRVDGTYTSSMCVKQDLHTSSGVNLVREYPNKTSVVNSDGHVDEESPHKTYLKSSSASTSYQLSDLIDKHNMEINFQYGGQQVPLSNCQSVADESHSPAYNHGVHDFHRGDSGFAKHSVPVQQAQSLRQYGDYAHVVSGSKHSNKRALNNVDSGDSKASETVLNDNNISSDEQLFLPPPPKQTKTSAGIRNPRKYDVARVPSAQAGFPTNFDARTVKSSDDEINSTDNDFIEFPDTKKETQRKTMQQKVEDNLKQKDLVIKSFNKNGSMPRFIPRQAQIKKRSELASAVPVNANDVLNKEIRTNAFKLGRIQGPSDNGPCSSNETLDKKERAVIDSVHHIRKKLAQVKEVKNMDKKHFL